MKLLSAQLAYFTQSTSARRNLGALGRILALFLVLVIIYSVLFHWLMSLEGREHSWMPGFYWTLTVMSTLGFGDITFVGDAGRIFSIVVLLSGVFLLLVIIPFTFLQFFYAPWMEAQTQARTPRHVPEEVSGHVLFTEYDPVAISLIARPEARGRPYYVLRPDSLEALALYDKGIKVLLGAADDQHTFERLRADVASVVVVSGDDHTNTMSRSRSARSASRSRS